MTLRKQVRMTFESRPGQMHPSMRFQEYSGQLFVNRFGCGAFKRLAGLSVFGGGR